MSDIPSLNDVGEPQIDWDNAPTDYPIYIECSLIPNGSGWHRDGGDRWVDQAGRYFWKGHDIITVHAPAEREGGALLKENYADEECRAVDQMMADGRTADRHLCARLYRAGWHKVAR